MIVQIEDKVLELILDVLVKQKSRINRKKDGDNYMELEKCISQVYNVLYTRQ